MENTRTARPWARRRSQRIPLAVPLFITSLDPNFKFAERCETESVSKHGCVARVPRELPPQTRIRLDIPHTNRATSALVVYAEKSEEAREFRVALELEKAENFWGLQFPPEDWAETAREMRKTGPVMPEQAEKEAAGPIEEKTAAPAPEAPRPTPPPPPAPKPAAAPPPPKAEAPPPRPQAPAAQPSPPRAEAPPQPQAPAGQAPAVDVEQQANQVEAALRERAKTLSKEFEDSYRQSLGDLLMRMRADLEERSIKDWERLRGEAEGRLRGLVGEVREQIEKEAAQRQQVEGGAEAKLQTTQELLGEVDARLQQFGQRLDEQVAEQRDGLVNRLQAEAEQLRSQVRQEVETELNRRREGLGELEKVFETSRGLEGQVAEQRDALLNQFQGELENLRNQARQDVETELNRRREGLGELEKLLDATRQERTYVESLTRMLPQTVNDRVEERVGGLLERLRNATQEEFGGQREAAADFLQQQADAAGRQLEGDLRQKLLDDLDRNERELLDRVNVRLEEIRSLEGRLRQYIGDVNADWQRRSEELLGRLQARLDEHAGQRQEALASRLEEKSRQLHQRAEHVMRGLGDQAWASLRQRLTQEFDERQRGLRQDLVLAEQQTNRLEERAAEFAERLDVGLQERLDRAVAETAERAREELARESRAAQDKHLTVTAERLAELTKQFEEKLAPQVSRGEAVSYDLRQLLDSLERQQGQVAEEARRLQAATEQARTWFEEERRQAEKAVHDGLLEATGQIKGRIHQAVEMAQEPLERQGRELEARLEELGARVRAAAEEQTRALETRMEQLTARTAEELARREEDARQRMEAIQAETRSSLETMLSERLAEALAEFRRATEQAAEESVARVQGNLNEALESISRILRDKLS